MLPPLDLAVVGSRYARNEITVLRREESDQTLYNEIGDFAIYHIIPLYTITPTSLGPVISATVERFKDRLPGGIIAQLVVATARAEIAARGTMKGA